RKEKLSELIYENIVGLIKDGEYEIGSKLPSENELAAYYKVSRAPVREAIRQLISMGYVESSKGRGTYVKNISAADEIKEYTYGKFDKKELFDLLEMRTILEVQSARLAAERRTAEDLMKIEAALEEFKKITQNQRIIGMKADYDFHEAIIISTENDFMIQTFNNLQSVHHNALEFSLKLNIGKPRKREMVYSEHAGVFEAIKNGDAEIASRRIKEHLINMRRRLGGDRIKWEAIMENVDLKEYENIKETSLNIEIDDRTSYGYDGSFGQYIPDCVAQVMSTEEVQKIMEIADRHEVPVCARGASTSLSGGPLPVQGGIVLDFSQWDTKFEIYPDDLI